MTAVHLTPEQSKSIGDLLKTAREKQGKNIADAAYQIALSPAQLRAIEAADLRPFYSHSFFHQAAQRYASFLNVELPVVVEESPAVEIAPIAITASTTSTASSTPSDEVSRNTSTPSTTESVSIANQSEDHVATSPITAPAVFAPSKEKTSSRRWPALALAAAIAVIAISVGMDRESITTATPIDNNTATAAPSAGNNDSPGATPPASPTATAPTVTTPVAAANATAPAMAAATTAPVSTAASKSSDTAEKADSLLESAATAWVQIVKKNGDKSNLKIEPGHKIEFASASTAAIVFGQPDKAKLMVKGKPVDINRFVTPDSPGRALVILNQIQ